MNKVFKVLSAAVLAGVVAVSAVCSVSAAGLNNGEQKIIDELKTTVNLAGTATKLPAQYINQAENYFLQDDVDITDAQAESALQSIQSKVSSNVEVSLINGGQPIYYFILSVE